MQSHDQISLSQPCSSSSKTMKHKIIDENVKKECIIRHSAADNVFNDNENISSTDDVSSVSYSHKKQFWEQISKNDPDILDQRKAHDRTVKVGLKTESKIELDHIEDRPSDITISEVPKDSSKFIDTEQIVATSATIPSKKEDVIEDDDNTTVTLLRKKFESAASNPNVELKRAQSMEAKEQKNSFETIIRNEIIEQQMLQQPEEGSPERKEISRSSTNIKDVSVNKEQILSRHIHTHIFSNELEENIEQLIPEDKDIRPNQETNDQDEDREEEPQTSGYFSDIQKDTIHSSSMDDDDSGSKSIKEKIGAFEKMMAEEETKVMFPFGKKTYIDRKKELALEENIERSTVSDKHHLNESLAFAQQLDTDSDSMKLELNLTKNFVESNVTTDISSDILHFAKKFDNDSGIKGIKCITDPNISTDKSSKIEKMTPEEVRCIAIEFVNEIEKRVELENTNIEFTSDIQQIDSQNKLHIGNDDIRSMTEGDKLDSYLYESVGIENFPATDSGVKKTIAVVRESLEAAQETLIEEQKKSKGSDNFSDKKRSPSDFEFKISQFDKMNKMEQFILEENAEEILTSGMVSDQLLKDQNLEIVSQDSKDSDKVKRTVNTSDDSDKDDAKSSNGGTGASEDHTTSSLSHEKNTRKLPQRREIEKIIETETPVVLRRKKQIHRLDGDSSSSSREVSLRVDRRSGADFDLCSSSGESHYHSFDDNVRTNSRPCSSDVEAFMLGTATSSEYESALTSQEHSQRSTTSQEYHTAVSSLSSRESMKSLDSESSGHLASIEVSSEASETLIPSAMELEKDMEEIDTPMQDEIAIRCEPNEIRTAEYEYLTGDSSEQDEVENIINLESIVVLEKVIDNVNKDEDVDDTINNDFSDAEEDTNMPITDDDTSLTERPRMKRSLEMTFHPEPKPILTGSPLSDTQFTGDESEKMVSSYEDGILSASISEQGMKTTIENLCQSNEQLDFSRQSDKSFSSDIINNLTTSNTSASVSSDSKDDIKSIVDIREISSFDIGTTTDLTDSSQTKFETNSVILLTSTTSISGIYNASTQVTSNKEFKDDVAIESDSEAKRSKKSFEIGHRRSESVISHTLQDVAKEEYVTTKKEQQDIEKKDIDESEHDVEIHKFKKSYIVETKYSDSDVKEVDDFDIQDTELKELVDSRPTSKADSNISKSDSENQRPFSSAFSDDHPDSEINELLRHCSSVDKDTDDPIERPKTPEPADCADLLADEQEDISVFSEEIIAHSNEILNSCEESVVDKLSTSRVKDHCSDDVREADIAFHLINRTTPTFPNLQDTIPEDESEECVEECTSTLRNLISSPNNDLQSNYIPDITVTQHMTPLKDSGFHYPDLELHDDSIIEEKDEKSTPQTPASMSSHVSEKSSETETDQGREYIVCDELANLDNETDGTSAIDIIPETANEDNSRESPDTDSFEMLDKNEIEKAEISDIKNDFVIVEEIGKEADENCEIAAFPQSIPSTRGVKIKKKVKSKDDDDDDLLVSSPPPTSTRLTEIKYYPEEEKTEEGQFKIDTDSPPETHTKAAKCTTNVMQEYQRDVEEGKKWIEMQFQGSEHPYGYDVEYERGPLEDIEERREEEEMVDAEPSRTSSKVGSLGSYKDSFSSTPEYDVLAGKKYFTRSGEHDDVSMSSLQEFERLEREIGIDNNRRQSSSGSQDSLNGSLPKRQFGKSGQGDDISLSSLKEFERLEIACIQAEKIEIKAKEEEALLSEIDEGHESQVSESESCETISEAGKESDSDDYEKRMFEIDEIIRQAQCNVEQFEKESGTGIQVKFKHDLKSKKMGNLMKEILKQSSAEDTDSNLIEKTEGKSEHDSLEDTHIPEIDMDISVTQSDFDILLNSNQVTTEVGCSVSNVIISSKIQHGESKREQRISDDEHDSLQDDYTGISVPAMQASTDSLDLRTVTQSDCIMTASIDSIEFQQSSQQRDIMVTSVDSIELAAKQMTISCDSLDSGAVTSSVLKKSGSVDSIEEEAKGSISGCQTKSSSSGREGDLSSSGKDDSCDKDLAKYGSDIMICSTDSLEPSSSTATHATYQYETDSVMSSSFTSGGSATMMSSTDTLDPELKIASPTERFDEVRQLLEAQAAGAAIPGVFDDDGNFQPEGGESHTFTDFDGNLRTVIHYSNLKQTTKPYVTEVIEPLCRDASSEKNKDVCGSTMPQLQKELCSDADKLSKSNVKKYYSEGHVLEYEDIRSAEKFGAEDLSQRRVTICSQGGVESVNKILSTPLSGIDVNIFENKSGEKIDTNLLPECSIVRMDPRSCSTEIAQSTYITRNIITQHVPTSDPTFPNIQQSILSSQPGITSELTGVPGSSERTEDEAHGDIPIRVSSSDSCRPVRAISIDDDSENVEVDLREHDWRFDLQALHEEPQGMIHDSDIISAGLEIVGGEPTTHRRVVTTQTRTTIGPDGEPVTVTETTETTTEEAAASLASLSRHSPDHFVERN